MPYLYQCVKNCPHEKSFALRAMAAIGKASVPHLTEFLYEEDRNIRGLAARSLGEIGPEARDAVPALIHALERDTPHSGAALCRIGRPGIIGLAAALGHSDVKVRRRASGAFYCPSEAIVEEIPALIHALADPDEKVRSHCSQALRRHGEASLPALRMALRDENRLIREGAVCALGGLYDRADEVLSDILGVMEDSEPEVRLGAIKAIDTFACFRKDIRGAFPAILEATRDKDPEVREAAVKELRRFCLLEEGVFSVFETALEDESELVRRAAVLSIWHCGEDRPTDSFHLLIRTAANSSNRVSHGAIQSLSKIAGLESRAIPTLVKYLNCDDPGKRSAAARALGEAGETSEPAIPELLTALEDENRKDHCTIVESLGKIGLRPDIVVPALLTAMEEKGMESCAARALGAFGSAAAASVPVLIQSMRASRSDAVAGALTRIGEPSVPALVEVLQEGDVDMCVRSITILANMGPNAASAVPILVRTLDDPDVSVWKMSARALRRIGPDAREAVPVLMEMCNKGEEAERRLVAMEALQFIRSTDTALYQFYIMHLEDPDTIFACNATLGLSAFGIKAVPKLIELLNHELPKMRGTAATALGGIGPSAASSVPTLLYSLDDRTWYVRRNAVWALGEFRSAAVSAIPAIQDVLDDEHENVRETASAAIEKIKRR